MNLYTVWLDDYEKELVGLVTDNEKQSFMNNVVEDWRNYPTPIHTTGILNKERTAGTIRSQTGKALAVFLFEPIMINAHLTHDH